MVLPAIVAVSSPAEHAGEGWIDRGDRAVVAADQHQLLGQVPQPVAVARAFLHPLLQRLVGLVAASPRAGGDRSRRGRRYRSLRPHRRPEARQVADVGDPLATVLVRPVCLEGQPSRRPAPARCKGRRSANSASPMNVHHGAADRLLGRPEEPILIGAVGEAIDQGARSTKPISTGRQSAIRRKFRLARRQGFLGAAALDRIPDPVRRPPRSASPRPAGQCAAWRWWTERTARSRPLAQERHRDHRLCPDPAIGGIGRARVGGDVAIDAGAALAELGDVAAAERGERHAAAQVLDAVGIAGHQQDGFAVILELDLAILRPTRLAPRCRPSVSTAAAMMAPAGTAGAGRRRASAAAGAGFPRPCAR